MNKTLPICKRGNSYCSNCVRLGGRDCHRTLKKRLLSLNSHSIDPELFCIEKLSEGRYLSKYYEKSEEKAKNFNIFKIFIEMDKAILLLIVIRLLLLGL
jgi:hypothetical protein